jgi:hypothetical protein
MSGLPTPRHGSGVVAYTGHAMQSGRQQGQQAGCVVARGAVHDDPPPGRARAEGEGEVMATTGQTSKKPSKASKASHVEAPSKFIAVSYLTDAKQYLQAAPILHESRFERISSPLYFLISQSLELFLKAYIIARGGTHAEVTKSTKIRDSLLGLASRAKEPITSSKAGGLIGNRQRRF